jgi:hypothetical protein
LTTGDAKSCTENPFQLFLYDRAGFGVLTNRIDEIRVITEKPQERLVSSNHLGLRTWKVGRYSARARRRDVAAGS